MVEASAEVASRTPSPISTVTITLPPRLLGATKDTALLSTENAAFRAQMAPFTDQAEVTAYRLPSGGLFLVDAAVGDMTSRAPFLLYHRRSIAVDVGKDPGPPIAVPAGAGGGNGYCWKVVIEGSPAVNCALVDDESYVGIYEFDTSDVAAVAAKARLIRAVVRKAS